MFATKTHENRSFTKDDIGTLFFHSYEEANNIINLTSEIRDAASKLLSCFKNSVFLTDRNPIEFIADKASNTYFIFGNCLTKEEIDCKVLEFLSYSAYKSRPFSSNIKNKEFHAKMLNSINQYLDTNFSEQDMELIYTYLGSRCNHEKTLDFIRNGFDMDVLQNKKEEQIDEKDGIEIE